MNYWLVKSEPFKYSWETFEKEGKTIWDGVRNYAARNNLKAMQKGDKVFWYHSNKELAIVGIAEVIKTFYPDPTTDDPNWVVVDLKPLRKLKKPIPLALLKTDDRFKNMDLVRLSRLSVGRVSAEEWAAILELEK